jgi:nicotinamidase/pyrazinamidase
MRTVFIDIDTQIDFIFPAGALYVPGAEKVLPAIARLNAHAASKNIPLISTVDAHAENDPEFLEWPAHCVAGTVGQLKPQSTMVPGSNHFLVRKITTNCFAAPEMDRLLTELDPERCVVYGVVTEICVKFAAFGLLERRRRVEIVTDAVRSLAEQASAAMLLEFQSSGGILTTTAQVINS